MKSCPTCNRIYTDDTYQFCLDDGALLTTHYDPQATLQIPAARHTDQPRTEIFSLPGAPQISNPQAAVADPLPQKRGGKTRMVVGGVILLLTTGVLILGYLVWKGNQNALPETSKSDANVQTNSAANTSNVPASSNASANDDDKEPPESTGELNPQWLQGVWNGTGQQHAPKMTWTLKLTAENDTYTIEYPSLRCAGKWTLVETGEDHAKFKEVITRGLDRCSTDGDILIEKISDNQVSYKYTLPIIGEVATAKLSKGAVR